MNTNLDKIALDLYGKIQTRFPDIKIGDENAEVLSKKSDIPKARFFEFEYKEGDETLGTIAITLDEDDGIVVQVGGELADSNHHGAFKFIRSFRQFARNRLLKFDVQNIGKNELDKRDYHYRSKPKEQPMEPMMESKMFGTARMSYQDLGENAKLIVKHSQPINQDFAAGRTMHIESIYIENAEGERFKYPFKHLSGARALAEHLKHGGIPYDSIGKHITSLSEELAQLRKFKGHVTRNGALSEAMSDITPKVLERIDAVKKEVAMLQRPAYYEQFAESFAEQEEQMIPEEIMSDWIDRLTVRTFNEDLKTAFPYIFRLVGESDIPVKGLNPEDVLGEMHGRRDAYQRDYDSSVSGMGRKDSYAYQQDGGANDEGWDKEEWKPRETPHDVHINGKKWKTFGSHSHASNVAKKIKGATVHRSMEEDQFESFLNRLIKEDEEQENLLFSQDPEAQSQALEKLKGLLSGGMKPGVDGVNAALSLKGLIDSDAFTDDYLEGLTDQDDVGTAIKLFLQDVATGKTSIDGIPKAKEVAQNIIATKALDSSNTSGEPVGGQEMPAPPEAAAPLAPPPEAAAPAAPPVDPNAVPPEAAAPPVDPNAVPPAPAPVAESQGRGTNPRMIKAIHHAKRAGAKLDTKLDFGHKEMTLHDCIEECGMSPEDFGFNTDGGHEDPTHQMLKSIAGFWNAQDKNFTIGGTRAKTKVIKDFKNGEFGNASEEDLQKVLHMINKMDPSANEHELGHIKQLAGVGQQDHDMDEGSEQQDFDSMMQQFMQKHQGVNPDAMLDQFVKSHPDAKVTRNNTSSGTIDGKSASYDDAMNKFKGMAGNMGFDASGDDPTGNMMKSIQGKLGGMKLPQSGSQMNPQDMMKGMMGNMKMPGMNEDPELTAMLKIAGLRK